MIAKILKAPSPYQGGKARIAAKIIETINPDPNRLFVDICCGAGSVSLAAVNAGHDPKRIVMADIGPWGVFWKRIGKGTFKSRDVQINAR